LLLKVETSNQLCHTWVWLSWTLLSQE